MTVWRLTPPLTCTELRRALASIKKVKVSTGVDTVSYRMLKEAPESVTAVKGKVVLTMYAKVQRPER